MTYLITGASRGLGLELARSLARQGENLVLVARDAAALDAVGRELSARTRVLAVAADVGQEAERIVHEAVARFGRVDVLVNNASTVGPSPMPGLSDYRWEDLAQVLHTNVLAPLHLMQLCQAELVVNVTSDAAVNAYPGWGGYGLSKAALEHLSQTWAAEHPEVRVLVVDPGDMNTQMHREAEPGVDLSGLPGPEVAAPRVLDAMQRARVGCQRIQAAHLLVTP